MRNQHYFHLYLTESEHDIVESLITQWCKNKKSELIYYRKFKTGHIPCYREVKLIIPRTEIGMWEDFKKDNFIKPTKYEMKPMKFSGNYFYYPIGTKVKLRFDDQAETQEILGKVVTVISDSLSTAPYWGDVRDEETGKTYTIRLGEAIEI